MDPIVRRVYRANEHIELRYTEVAPDIVVRGVFAAQDIPEGTKIEECPVVPIYVDEPVSTMNSVRSYYYLWETSDPSTGQTVIKAALCMGLGAIYNHSSEPNITNVKHYRHLFMEFFTTRDVKQGEELLHDYGWSDGAYRLNPVDKWLRPIPPRRLKEMERDGEFPIPDDTPRTVWPM